VTHRVPTNKTMNTPKTDDGTLLNSTDLLVCPKCGKQPRVQLVAFTGEYYKCKECDFPKAQFPIPFNANAKQWNKTVSNYLANDQGMTAPQKTADNSTTENQL